MKVDLICQKKSNNKTIKYETTAIMNNKISLWNPFNWNNLTAILCEFTAFYRTPYMGSISADKVDNVVDDVTVTMVKECVKGGYPLKSFK